MRLLESIQAVFSIPEDQQWSIRPRTIVTGKPFPLAAAQLQLDELRERLHGYSLKPAICGFAVDCCFYHFHNHLNLCTFLPPACF